MSIITPIPQDTIIHLYSNIHWDDSYQDIRLFETEEERTAFFNRMDVYVTSFTKCSVISPGESIRLEGKINDLINCTYMTFNNGGLSDYGRRKTFYCFITGIDYVNVNCVEISYKIDWIQTYLFDFKIGACTVLREHVNDDSIGLWLHDEAIETGGYNITYQANLSYETAVLYYQLPDAPEFTLRGGVASGLLPLVFRTTDGGLDSLRVFVELLESEGKSQNVIQMTMCVARMSNMDDTMAYGQPANFGEAYDIAVHDAFTGSTGAYIPRNNKLRCYPYRYLVVDNYMGSANIYQWEFFEDPSKARFLVHGSPMPKPAMEIFPANYMGTRDDLGGDGNRQMGLQYTNFPDVPFSTDTYREWVSQYAGFAQLNTGISIANRFLGAVDSAINLHLGSFFGDLAGAYQSYASYQMEDKVQQIQSQHLRGNVETAGLQYSNGTVGFRVTQYAIRAEVAERIDQFFDRYGYRMRVVKVPNLRGRRYVNYVMTQGAHVEGEVPMEARRTLEAAMDRGCSFWHTNDVGMVLPDNPIIGG